MALGLLDLMQHVHVTVLKRLKTILDRRSTHPGTVC